MAEDSIKAISVVTTCRQGMDENAPDLMAFPRQEVAAESSTTRTTAKTSEAETGASSSSPVESWLHKAVQDTTKLLYQHSTNLSFWLAQPLPKIYVYATLRHDWSDPTNISDCIHRRFLFDEGKNQSRAICRWYPNRICSDQVGPESKREKLYMSYRGNFNTDIQYLEWFRNYPLRTYDPGEADLFVVPYPHWSHCLCHKNFTRRTALCSYKFQSIEDSVYPLLGFWNSSDERSTKRHLWLYGAAWGTLLRRVRGANHFSLHAGGTPCIGGGNNEKLCGHLVVPHTSTEPWYQPPTHKQEWWKDHVTDRRYAIGAVLGTPWHLKMRLEFIRNHRELLGDTVGGKPLKIVNLGQSRVPLKSIEIATVYRESILCPIFPGDNVSQRRFFEVVLNGCIPILPIWDSWETFNNTTFLSSFKDKGVSVQSTYPYHQSSFYGDDDAGIDYLGDLVVTFNGTCGIACLKATAEVVLSNATELDRLHRNLRKYSRLFSYGLEENAYRYSDGFAATLVSMRHYLYSLEG